MGAAVVVLDYGLSDLHFVRGIVALEVVFIFVFSIGLRAAVGPHIASWGRRTVVLLGDRKEAAELRK